MQFDCSGGIRLLIALIFVFRSVAFGQIVMNTKDDGDSGSLRAVLANAAAGATVRFDPSLSGATITITNGQLVLSRDVTIDGSNLPKSVTLRAQSRWPIAMPGLATVSVTFA